jgi:[acyl-carrier-protein] S-malonyltransferase
MLWRAPTIRRDPSLDENDQFEALRATQISQPATLMIDVAILRLMAAYGIFPDVVAGHSLGEYSALVYAGALQFADAVRLVHLRGKFMQEAVPPGAGGMAAILGLEKAAVEAACAEVAAETGAVVSAANLNGGGQVVIAGAKAAVGRAVELLKQRGAKRAVPLPVSAPFHCALMKPAADRLASELERLTVSAPRIPVVRNVDGGVTRTADEVKPFLVQQVASPVRWTDCVERLAREGATGFLEVGPGRVLTGLLKRTLDGARGHAVEDPASLEKALAALGGAAA